MGLLEDTYGPEVGQMMAQYGSLSPEIKKKALNDSLMNAGFAMLASNGLGATRNQSLGRALGAGGLAGVNTYNNSLEDAQRQQFGQMQMAGQMEKLIQQRKKQEQLAQFANSLSPEEKMQFGVDPEGFLKRKYESYNLGAGEKRFSGGKEVASGGPKLPEGFTIGPDGKMMVDPAYERFKTNLADRSASRININNPYEPAFNKELAALDAKSLDKMRSNADAGNQVLGSVARLRQLNPKVYSNGGAEAKMAAANMLAGFGINIGDPEKLANSQEFDALSSKLVIDSLGGSLGTGVSNSDVQFLKKTVPNIGQDIKARDALINFMERKAKSQISTYGAARQYAEKHNGLKGWTAPNFVDTSGIPAGAINELKMRKGDANSRAKFDEVFGAGSADSILGEK